MISKHYRENPFQKGRKLQVLMIIKLYNILMASGVLTESQVWINARRINVELKTQPVMISKHHWENPFQKRRKWQILVIIKLYSGLKVSIWLCMRMREWESECERESEKIVRRIGKIILQNYEVLSFPKIYAFNWWKQEHEYFLFLCLVECN